MNYLNHIHAYIRTNKRIRDVPRLPAKRYPRFSQITLSPLAPLPMSLTEALARRRSTMAPMTGTPLSLHNISQLLGHAMAIRSDGQRPHPSGGARYPFEAYLFAFTIDGLKRCSYHYSPENHQLEELWELPASLEPNNLLFDQMGHVARAGAILVLTAVWERSTSRYATFAFEPILMEAGHIGQNVVLLSTALGLTHRPFAGYTDQVAELLDLDTKEEEVVYTFALGL